MHLTLESDSNSNDRKYLVGVSDFQVNEDGSVTIFTPSDDGLDETTFGQYHVRSALDSTALDTVGFVDAITTYANDERYEMTISPSAENPNLQQKLRHLDWQNIQADKDDIMDI